MALDLSMHRIKDVTPLSALASLQELRLCYCSSVCSVDPLGGLTRLTCLDVCCTAVASLEPLSSLSLLEELDLSVCRQVTSLEPLASLSQLKRLSLKMSLSSCLSALSPLVHLEDLDLSCMHLVGSLEPLRPLSNLRRLDVQCCFSLTSLEALGCLSRLMDLTLASWHGLPLCALHPLAFCTALKQLDIRFCYFDVTPLFCCHSLRRLYTCEEQAGLKQLQALMPRLVVNEGKHRAKD